jgi:TRAP-type C4-dicarboxylate transport system substrate-binding protein
MTTVRACGWVGWMCWANVAAATPTVTSDAASVASGDATTRAEVGAPNGSILPYTTAANLAIPSNGFARPAVARDEIPGHTAIHTAAFVNDGLYGNGSSWIGGGAGSWVKIDLGREVLVDGIRFGRDRTGAFDDRDPGGVVVQLATTEAGYAPGDAAQDDVEYTTVADTAALGHSGQIAGAETVRVSFAPTRARYVKVTAAADGADLDEIEVSGSVPAPAVAAPPPPVVVVPPECAAGTWRLADGSCRTGALDVRVGVPSPNDAAAAEMLRSLARKWSELSGGNVRLVAGAAGTQGSEADILKKMRIGQLQGGLLSMLGVTDICDDCMALDVPGLVRTPSERDAVLLRIAPRLEGQFVAKGFVALAWGERGTTRVFSTVPRPTVAGLRGGKFYVADTLPVWGAAMGGLGLGTVSSGADDLVPAAQVGRVDTAAVTPVAALAQNLPLKTMSDLPFGRVDDALVVQRGVWEQIPEPLRGQLARAAREAASSRLRASRTAETNALRRLPSVGFQTVPFTEAATWDAALAAAYPTHFRGRLVSTEGWDLVVAHLAELRAR